MRWGNGNSMEYYKASNDVVIIALIEHIESIENIDAILGVDGIDVFFIAPMDLAASMGHVGNRDHPDVQAAIKRGEKAIKDAGRALGGLCLSADEGNTKISDGYQVLLMGFDLLLLEIGTKTMLDGLKR